MVIWGLPGAFLAQTYVPFDLSLLDGLLDIYARFQMSWNTVHAYFISGIVLRLTLCLLFRNHVYITWVLCASEEVPASARSQWEAAVERGGSQLGRWKWVPYLHGFVHQCRHVRWSAVTSARVSSMVYLNMHSCGRTCMYIHVHAVCTQFVCLSANLQLPFKRSSQSSWGSLLHGCWTFQKCTDLDKKKLGSSANDGYG